MIGRFGRSELLVFAALEALGPFLEALRGRQDEVCSCPRLFFSSLLIEITVFRISIPSCSGIATYGGLEGLVLLKSPLDRSMLTVEAVNIGLVTGQVGHRSEGFEDRSKQIMKTNGNRWKRMETDGHIWKLMEVYGRTGRSPDLKSSQRSKSI